LIAEIVPAGVSCAYRRGPGGRPPALLAAEAAALGTVGRARFRDFAEGRSCARRALRGLGYPPGPVLPGPDREPVWPPGAVGSITHCARYWAAAAVHRGDLAALGIDAEVHAGLPRGILDKVASQAERAGMANLPDGACWDRILFSAKESVYKAWFPVARAWLGFLDAVVTFDPPSRAFEAELLVGGMIVEGRRVRRLAGRFLARDGLIVTAAWAPDDRVSWF